MILQIFAAIAVVLAVSAAAQDPYSLPAAPAAPARPPAPPAELVLRIVSFEGYVELRRVGEKDWSEVAEVPVELNDRDRIHTYNDSGAVLKVDDGTEFVVGPFSILSAERKRQDLIVVALARGRLEASVPPAPPRRRRRLEARTPWASVWIEEGELLVEHSFGGTTVIALRSGSAEVRPKTGAAVTLAEGSEISVTEAGAGAPGPAVSRSIPKPTRGKVEVVQGAKDSPRPPPPPRSPRAERVSRLAREEVARELGFTMARESVESAAALAAKAPVYQEGRVLLDPLGRRVRVEDYLSRPDSRSFKLVTINRRSGRMDWATFEVTANVSLPENLAQAGNLWFKNGSVKPPYFAVRERWSVSNGRDSVDRLLVDGDSRAVDVPVRPVYDPATGQFQNQIVSPAFQTVFGNSYEFINGSAAGIDRIWRETGAGAFRPLDNGVSAGTSVGGMAWHAQPVQVDVRDVAVPATRLATYWENAFISLNPADASGNATGRTFIEAFEFPLSFRGEYRERRFYINFRDTNGNGLQDFAEITQAGCAFGSCAVANVFYDRAARLDGETLTALPGAGCLGTTAACGTNDGDTVYFSDLNGNGLLNAGEASLVGPTSAFDAALLNFAAASPRAWQEARHMAGTDSGGILDTGTQFPFPVAGKTVSAVNQASGIFERFVYQRALTSSEFGDRSIDLVMTPVTFLTAGLLEPKAVHGEAPAPAGGPIVP